jgi:hypothetical protein
MSQCLSKTKGNKRNQDGQFSERFGNPTHEAGVVTSRPQSLVTSFNSLQQNSQRRMRKIRKAEPGRPYPSCDLDAQITSLLEFGETNVNYEAKFDI